MPATCNGGAPRRGWRWSLASSSNTRGEAPRAGSRGAARRWPRWRAAGPRARARSGDRGRRYRPRCARLLCPRSFQARLVLGREIGRHAHRARSARDVRGRRRLLPGELDWYRRRSRPSSSSTQLIVNASRRPCISRGARTYMRAPKWPRPMPALVDGAVAGAERSARWRRSTRNR